MANRILGAIGRMRAHPKLPSFDEGQLDNTFQEHYAFQQAQARAHVEGRLTTEEALVVYRALGETYSKTSGGWSVGTDKATKVVVIRLMGELLEVAA